MALLKIIISCILLILILFLCIVRVKEASNKKYRKNLSSTELPPDFEAIYKKLYEELSNSSYKDKVEQLKKTRDKCRILNNIIYMADIMVLIIVMWIILTSKPEAITSNIIVLILIPAALFLWTLLITNTKSVYAKEYKNIVFANFVKKIDKSELEYIESDIEGYGTMKNLYKEAHSGDYKFDNFISQDYITGFLCENKKNPVKIGDLEVTNGMGTSKEKLFSGIFLVAEKNKPTAEKIRIYVDGNKIASANKDATPEIIQKYMRINTTQTGLELSPSIKQIIMDFAIQNKIHFEIIIKENKIYFKFYTGNLFEPKIFGPTTDVKELILFYNIIKFAKVMIPSE